MKTLNYGSLCARAFFSSRLGIAASIMRMRSAVVAVNDAATAPTGTVSAINVEAEKDSEWMTIKYGVYPNEVGLQVFDKQGAEKMVRAFNSLSERYANLFRGQPMYVGHPDDREWKKANPSIREEAVGRITQLRADEDGLKLKRALNDEGKRLTSGDAPAYTAFSPNWGMEPTTHQGRKAFRPMYLFSVGLTNRPQIPGTFIGLNEALPLETNNSAMNKYIIALLAALGRPVANAAAVTDEQLATAVNEAVPVATKLVENSGLLTVAINDKAILQTQLTAAQGQVTTAVNEAATLRTSLATERSARAGIVIATAINEGRLTEAGRAEWLGKFTATNADFSAVEGELGKLKKGINTQSQTAGLGARRGAPADKGKITAINEAIVAKMAAMKTTDRNAAYLALQSEGHALFTNAKAE